MRLIEPPNWSRAAIYAVDADFDPAVVEQILQHLPVVPEQLQRAVQTYLDETPDEGLFPLKERMTGEFYAGDLSFHLHASETGAPVHRFSILARCLEKQEYVPTPDRDYLGLEVHFVWSAPTHSAIFEGDVDSSSI